MEGAGHPVAVGPQLAPVGLDQAREGRLVAVLRGLQQRLLGAHRRGARGARREPAAQKKLSGAAMSFARPRRLMVMTNLHDPLFGLYAACASILILTLYGLGFWTAKIRAQRRAVVNPEDVKVNSGAAVVEVEHPDVQRIKRAHLNALENAVPFFVIGFLYCQTAPGLGVARALFIAFVTVRVLHALFYLNAKQPFRTASFALGAVINLAMAVQVLRAVFS